MMSNPLIVAFLWFHAVFAVVTVAGILYYNLKETR